MKTTTIHLPDIVGSGYRDFWHFRGRYRVVKGGRASKKSKTAALWFIYHMMKHPEANLLVVRKFHYTLKDSCYTELKWAIRRFGVESLWEMKLSPLEMTYKPTGQRIYFRGLDDPFKITSIAAEYGHLCWLWIEEAYEIADEDDFNVLDESIRGVMPADLWKMSTLTFNPWNEHHWLKRRFFDNPDSDVFTLTTNYLCNEWLDDKDLRFYETMRERNPRRYQVAGLGNWGVVEGLVYDMFTNECIYNHELPKGTSRYIAIDYGTVNPCVFLDIRVTDSAVFVCREYYYDSVEAGRQKSDSEYAADLREFVGKELPTYVIIDPSAASFKLEARRLNLRVKDADNTVLDGIRCVSNLFETGRLFIHSSCKQTIKELSNYAWDTRAVQNGRETPIKQGDHACDALRYFCYTILSKARWANA